MSTDAVTSLLAAASSVAAQRKEEKRMAKMAKNREYARLARAVRKTNDQILRVNLAILQEENRLLRCQLAGAQREIDSLRGNPARPEQIDWEPTEEEQLLRGMLVSPQHYDESTVSLELLF